jgi:hypothetical protein
LKQEAQTAKELAADEEKEMSQAQKEKAKARAFSETLKQINSLTNVIETSSSDPESPISEESRDQTPRPVKSFEEESIQDLLADVKYALFFFFLSLGSLVIDLSACLFVFPAVQW